MKIKHAKIVFSTMLYLSMNHYMQNSVQ